MSLAWRLGCCAACRGSEEDWNGPPAAGEWGTDERGKLLESCETLLSVPRAHFFQLLLPPVQDVWPVFSVFLHKLETAAATADQSVCLSVRPSGHLPILRSTIREVVRTE